MSESLIFAFPGNEAMAQHLATQLYAEIGSLEVHRFPDEESGVRFLSDVRGRHIVFVCTLDRPDAKFLPLIFAAATARELGAQSVGLVAPYLCYMRQDRRFAPGEVVTAPIFAAELSRAFDWLVTIDPHLHRIAALETIYSIPAIALHAAPLIAGWIKREVSSPLVIGPDAESKQWVADVASRTGAPYAILQKIRRGDRDVEIVVNDAARFRGHTPVLVDDIISTGETLIEAIAHLQRGGLSSPVVIGVHAVFASGAYDALKKVARIVTTNTITHQTNAIDITGLLANGIRTQLRTEP